MRFPFDDSAFPVGPPEECVPVGRFLMLDEIYTEEPDEFGAGPTAQRLRVFDTGEGDWINDLSESTTYQLAIGLHEAVAFHSPDSSSFSRVRLRLGSGSTEWTVNVAGETPELALNPFQGVGLVGRDELGRLVALLYDATGDPAHGGLPTPPTYYLRRFDEEGDADVQVTLNNAWLPANPFEYNNTGRTLAVLGDVAVIPWLMFVDDMDAHYYMHLLGVSLTTGDVLWDVELDDELGLVWADFHADFAGEALFVAGTWAPISGDDITHLIRLDFPDGVEMEPEVTWRITPSLGPNLSHMVVTESRVVLLAPDGDDTVVAAFDHAGDPAWDKVYTGGHSALHLACDGETVCVAVRQVDEFNDKVLGGQRYEFYDAVTGVARGYSPATAPEFGLSEVGTVGATSVCVDDEGGGPAS